MNKPIASTLIALAAVFSSAAMAAGEHQGHGAMTPAMQSQAPLPMVDGLVKKVDKAAGKVTLAHGPLTHLGMTMGMTMAFRVKDAAWLNQMKEGDKIRFAADNVNGAITIVVFEPAK